MISFYELKYVFVKKRFEEQFHKNIANGKFKKFDEKFYQQFDGMYYNGLPIYYYLRLDNMNKCYETSAILALALHSNNICICRGVLKKQSTIELTAFDHGWIEIGDKVYDTTWQIIADKKTYYKVFGAVCEERTEKERYFADPMHTKDRIHDKAYYENSYDFLHHLLVEGTRQTEEIKIQTYQPLSERFFVTKRLLEDLPTIKRKSVTSLMTELLADSSNMQRLSADDCSPNV